MLKQKEDVILVVKHVRYKKVDGTLYVNSGRVAWRNQTSDTFRISAKFEDIKVQRISPDQKEKVQLQLVMHNGESFTFQFADPGGRDKQMEMRNNVKAMLQNLLPKFQDKAQAELKEKFRLLESNPEILQSYKELVVSGILSSDDFWARPEFSNTATTVTAADSNHNASTKNNQTSTKIRNSGTMDSNKSDSASSHTTATMGQISRSFQLTDQPQVVGVPSYLLSDIKPEADGANGIKYNLTHETIDAIFRAYPTVRQRHRELVPDKLSEADFWIKFFQSHYFHRDRVQLPKEDIFAECASTDERHLLNDLRRSRRNRISAHLDLASLTDHDLGPGYGVESTSQKYTNCTTIGQKTENNSSDNTNSNFSANQLLLRRFNNHSILVLKSLGSNDITPNLVLMNTPTQPSQTASSQDSSSNVLLKERIYGAELVKDPDPPHFRLDLSSVNDYLEGPTFTTSDITQKKVDTSINSLRPSGNTLPHSRLEQAVNLCKSSMISAYQTKRKPDYPLLTAMESRLALADVSPGGCLVGGKPNDDRLQSNELVNDQTSGRVVDSSRVGHISTVQRQSEESSSGQDVDRGPALLNAEQQRELSLLYASASELLRHFWACFPVTNQQLAEKLDRIASSLTRFRASKLSHFAASLDQSFGNKSDSSIPVNNSDNPGHRNNLGSINYRSRVTGHLESMLEAAQQKYSEWQNRRTR